jgi:predicted TIM-barrel fold metal-dependent hydrolase
MSPLEVSRSHLQADRPVTRRELLRTSTAAAFGALLPAAVMRGEEVSPPAAAAPPLIDVHHHMLPPRYVAEVRDALLATAPGFERVLSWTPQQSVEEMDRTGVASAVVSTSAPGFWFGDVDQSRRLQRECNEFAARMVADYPERFGMFAGITLPDVEGSLREIEYALDVLKADGIGLLSNYGETWPGDPAFDPVFEELDRRKAVVYVHPQTADCCKGLLPEIPDAMIEFPFDTTRAVSRLLYSGTLSRCPDIRFIFSHGGGTVPMLADRMSFPARVWAKLAARLPNGVTHELKKLFYDTASVVNPPAFAALSELVANSQILFGTDFPFVPIAASTGPLAGLGLSRDELENIGRHNALALIPRFRATAPA